MLLHVLDEGLGDLELVSGGSYLAAGADKLILGLDLDGVIHNIVAELKPDVLSQLLDASAAGLGGAVLVNELVALPLEGLAISAEAGQKLLVHRELTPEEGVLGGVHGEPVHLKQGQVNTGHGLDEALEGGGDLEFLEHAGGHTDGAGETDLGGKFVKTKQKTSNELDISSLTISFLSNVLSDFTWLLMRMGALMELPTMVLTIMS